MVLSFIVLYMEQLIGLGNVQRYHFVDPTHDDINTFLISYDIHDLILKDIVDPDVHEKIDVYDNLVFFVLEFPKYDDASQRYLANRCIFLVSDSFVVTIASFASSHIQRIVQTFHREINEKEDDEQYMVSPYYLLYNILDTMYSKVQKLLKYWLRDVREIETILFGSDSHDSSMIMTLSKKKRNIIFLKHLLESHGEILRELHKTTKSKHSGDFDVYFEDLEYKYDKLQGLIWQSQEWLDSLFSTFHVMTDIRTNNNVVNLTIVTVILGCFSVLTGFFGMNVPLPWSNRPWMSMVIFCLIIAVLWAVWRRLYKKW